VSDRILIINYEYPPVGAGASNATFHIATSLVRMGHNVHVITSAFGPLSGFSTEHGINIFRLKTLRRKKEQSSLLEMLQFLITVLFHLPSIVERVKPSACLIFFAFPCGPAGLPLKLIWKIPYILLLRGGDVPGSDPSVESIHRLLSPLRRIVYKNSDAVIANSKGLQELALQYDPDISIHVVTNGVDTAFFTPRLNLKKDTEPFTFIYTGRICSQKNLGVLLKSFSLLRARYGNVRLYMVGNGPDLKRLQSLNESISNKDIVIWVNWCDKGKLREYYHVSDCFIIPSKGEGMSNSVLEAMSCGLPVIASDCAGNTQLITNGDNGYLFNPEDPIALCDLMYLLSKSPQHAKELGLNGREKCLASFSWDSTADLLYRFLT
jgi:glycosyltransferase involved in cell wall biosynthesis